MPNEEVTLEEGLKWMFMLIAASLTLTSRLPDEAFEKNQDELVQNFINGLRKNGYEIVKIANGSA